MYEEGTRPVMCSERHCDWEGIQSDVLRAPNPFDAEDEVFGCPKCKQIGTILFRCDEPDCHREGSCGVPTPEGYRHTCGLHAPWKRED